MVCFCWFVFLFCLFRNILPCIRAELNTWFFTWLKYVCMYWWTLPLPIEILKKTKIQFESGRRVNMTTIRYVIMLSLTIWKAHQHHQRLVFCKWTSFYSKTWILKLQNISTLSFLYLSLSFKNPLPTTIWPFACCIN